MDLVGGLVNCGTRLAQAHRATLARRCEETAQDIAQNALGCLEPSDPGDVLTAIEGVFSNQVVARAAIKLRAVKILLDTYSRESAREQLGDHLAHHVVGPP